MLSNENATRVATLIIHPTCLFITRVLAGPYLNSGEARNFQGSRIETFALVKTFMGAIQSMLGNPLSKARGWDFERDAPAENEAYLKIC